MICLKSPSHDPYWNLALEEALFAHARLDTTYCMLWQNRPAVIIGQHQNPAEEVDLSYIRTHSLPVIRRLSGGGAVYHDLGGLNYTFILSGEDIRLNWEVFYQPVLRACQSLGIPAKASGRNDLTVEGRKFSGTASYEADGKSLHHGCLLIHSDFSAMAQALTPPKDKFHSKAAASVPSRVINLRDCCPNLTVEAFCQALLAQLPDARLLPEIPSEITTQANHLRDSRYATWEWNFGSSPLYAVTKRRRFPDCGSITVQMDVTGGKIAALCFSGDFFGKLPPVQLADRLIGCSLQRDALAKALAGLDLTDYFRRIDPQAFLDWLAL